MLEVYLITYKRLTILQDKFRGSFYWYLTFPHCSVKLVCNNVGTYVHFYSTATKGSKNNWYSQKIENYLRKNFYKQTIEIHVGTINIDIKEVIAFSNKLPCNQRTWIYIVAQWFAYLCPNNLWFFNNQICTENAASLINFILKTNYKEKQFPNLLLKEIQNETKNLCRWTNVRNRKQ